MPDACVVVDDAGTVVYANGLVEGVFGYAPADLVGRSVEMLVPDQMRAQHRLHRRAYGETRASRPMGAASALLDHTASPAVSTAGIPLVSVSDLMGLHESGREFPVDISLSPIESDEGPLVIAAVRDMSERRKVEHELRRVNERLRRDVNVAARIQRSLLPDRSADIPGIDVEWLFEPCDRLGGDSFNVFDAANGFVGFYLLDVTGHGIVTALQSVALTRILASTWPQPNNPMPARLAERLNAEFPVNVDAWQYFTFLGGVLDLSGRALRYVSAGHHGPIHVPAGGAPVALKAEGLPIGMFPECAYEEFGHELRPGDRLYLFSDGVTEAMNEAEDDYGLGGLVATLTEVGERPLGETLREVRRAVGRWCGGGRNAGRLHAGGAGGQVAIPPASTAGCSSADRRAARLGGFPCLSAASALPVSRPCPEAVLDPASRHWAPPGARTTREGNRTSPPPARSRTPDAPSAPRRRVRTEAPPRGGGAPGPGRELGRRHRGSAAGRRRAGESGTCPRYSIGCSDP